MKTEVILIKSQQFGWVIGKVHNSEQSENDELSYYKGFGNWDNRFDMAEFFDTEEEAVTVCNNYGYLII